MKFADPKETAAPIPASKTDRVSMDPVASMATNVGTRGHTSTQRWMLLGSAATNYEALGAK